MHLKERRWQFRLSGAERLFVNPTYTRVLLLYYYPSSLKKRKNIVVSVGKSEKSSEKVFQNAYTAYTNYTDIGLDPH